MSTDKKQVINTIQDNGGLGCVIRYRFVKGETVRYISHLDMLHTFERAVRRAHIPISYSRGYNPHPSLIFGMALSLGVSSECEAMDMGLAEKCEIDVTLDKANKALPMDLQLLDGQFTPPKNSIMAAVYAGTYALLVETEGGTAKIAEAINKMMASEEVIAIKKSKDSSKEVNIKHMIKGLEAWDYTGHDCDTRIFKKPEHPAVAAIADAWAMTLDREAGKLTVIKLDCTMGCKDNLRPDMFMNALSTVCGQDVRCIKIHKSEMHYN
ncbi:MAG: TIGR03936 family radical SAM-associated protein [Clostridia bacterium]|nr:TIGR03936 family radical SAM-associated protein [Clostridia bacterium]